MKNKSPKESHADATNSNRLKRFLFPALIIGILVAGMVVFARTPMIFVTSNNNGVFLASTYRMQEDNFLNPRLTLLRRREHLDKVVAPGKTQFEKMVLLRKWAHDQWKSTGGFFYPAWDAAEILDLVRKQDNRGFCAQYAIVFLQACQSMGIHARYIELPGHFLVGAWSDDYDRWVIMDPTGDVHYERNGEPLRGGYLCNAYWKNDVKGIFRVDSSGNKTQVARKDLEGFRMYSIVENANQLTDPPSVQVNKGAWKKLEHQADFRNYPLIGRDELVIASPYLAWKQDGAAEYFQDKKLSDDPDDFNYVLNQSLIFVARRRPSKGLIKVVFFPENSPTFDRFIVKIDDDDWKPVDVREAGWELKPGENRLSARIETKFGWKGPISNMKVYYKPKWI